jgi:hypothetical protein
MSNMAQHGVSLAGAYLGSQILIVKEIDGGRRPYHVVREAAKGVPPQ